MTKGYNPKPEGEFEFLGKVGSRNEAFIPKLEVSTELSQKKHQEQKDRKLRRKRFKRKKHGRS